MSFQSIILIDQRIRWNSIEIQKKKIDFWCITDFAITAKSLYGDLADKDTFAAAVGTLFTEDASE